MIDNFLFNVENIMFLPNIIIHFIGPLKTWLTILADLQCPEAIPQWVPSILAIKQPVIYLLIFNVILKP